MPQRKIPRAAAKTQCSEKKKKKRIRTRKAEIEMMCTVLWLFYKMLISEPSVKCFVIDRRIPFQVL